MSKAPNDEPSARKWRSAARIDVLPLLLAPTRIVVLGSISSWTLPSRRNWQSSTNRRDICPDNDVVASAADIVAPLNPYRDAPTCSSLAPRRKLESFHLDAVEAQLERIDTASHITASLKNANP